MKRRGRGHRLATVLFTDIVGSSTVAAELGDRRWQALLARHHVIVRRELKRYGGRELDNAGDGFFATFDEPSDAIRCACAVSDGVRELGIELRAGLNLGEAEVIGHKLGGMAVHAGARIMSLAGPGDVLLSSTIRDLVPGSGFEFSDRGLQELRDIPGEWRLYAVSAVDGTARAVPLDADDAAERRQSIQPPPLLQRRGGRMLAGALVLGVIAAAVTVPLATRKPPPPEPLRILSNSLLRIDPSTGRVIAVVRLQALGGGQITTVPGGDIWVMAGESHLLWIVDPSKNQARSVSGGDAFLFGVAYGYGSVWVAGANKTISRLNPETYPVTRAVDQTIPLPRASGALLALDEQMHWPDGDGMVWTNVVDLNQAVGIDVRTNEIRMTTKTGAGTNGVAVGEGAVWISNYADGSISKIDPTTGKSTLIPDNDGPADMTVGFRSVWVSDPLGGKVSRIDPGDITVEKIAIGLGASQAASGICVGPTSVWVASPAGALVEIDPATNRVSMKKTLPYIPSAVVYADGSIWVTETGARPLHP